MPFKPYHLFDNRTRLTGLVSTLKERGSITDDVDENFNRYHPAMIHKLKSAKYNLERLTETLTQASIQEATDMRGEFMFEVNMFIDGFFYNAGSAMDILARVVLTLFGEPLPRNIYFETAYAQISASRPSDAILQKISEPTWRQAFRDYRNTLTHELILASRCHITLDMTDISQPNNIIFPLPDDPRATPLERTYRRNPNVQNYVVKHFTRVLSLANIVYGHIIERARADGSLPI